MKKAWLFIKWCFVPKGIIGGEVMTAMPSSVPLPGFVRGMHNHTCIKCGKHYQSYPGKKHPQPVCLRWQCYRDFHMGVVR